MKFSAAVRGERQGKRGKVETVKANEGRSKVKV